MKDVLIFFLHPHSVLSLYGTDHPYVAQLTDAYFSEAKAVSGFSYMMLAQNIGKVCSSFFILKIVATYAFSLASSAWVFMGTGLLSIGGSLCFFLTTEVADPDYSHRFRISTSF